MKDIVKKNRSFIWLLIGTDFVFVFLAWILRPTAFQNVAVFIALFSLFVIAAAVFLERRRLRRLTAAFETFLNLPDEKNKAALLRLAGVEWKSGIESLYRKITAQDFLINEAKMELISYQEFIEAWVHEMKTPLSLSTLILNNRRDEMSAAVYSRMNHVQQQLGEGVERILYYARLQTEHPDFKFTNVRLDRLVWETAGEYELLAKENHISIQLDLQPHTIFSDQKVLRFMLSQLLGNACKYADKEQGEISVSSWREEDNIHLAIRNNGAGIAPEDAPFIFDKGFTGNHPDRQKATGMGLYLVHKYAEALCLRILLEPVSTTGTGFGIELIFAL